MVPMMNKPMMEHIIELLKSHKITRIVTTLFYQPEAITGYFGDGSAFGVELQYRRAEADYGTAGSVRNAKDFLDEQFIIISGVVLTDFDLSAAVEYHRSRKAKATIVLTRVANPLQFGVVLTNKEGKITRFLEKPSWGEVFSDTINTGIYILEPEVLDFIPEKEEFDFSKNLFPLLLERDMGLYGFICEGYWRDIGSLNEYQDGHLDALSGKVKLTLEGMQNGNSRFGAGARIQTEQKNVYMSLIGKGSTIHAGAVVSNSVIGDGCEIFPGAVIRNSIIWRGSKVGAGSDLWSDVVGFDCEIGEEAVILENVFISDRCHIGRRAKLLSNIKLWPEKSVEEGAVVSRSLVWEDRWLRELFTEARVTGLSNIEMNPEFGAKLGAAFGAFVGAGATVVTSRDADNVSRMVNRAIITGLMSAGVNCIDLRASSIPIVRHELRSGRERGGIHVRKSPFDASSTDIIFFDGTGKDLPTGKTKSVERLFSGEEFTRAPYDQVGSIAFSERATESYIEHFLATIQTSIIRTAGIKLVIDFSNGIASTIFPNVLGNLNVQVLSLNAYVDNRKFTRTKEEFEYSLEQLSHVVTSLDYDFGIMLDAGAEKIFLVDEHGASIDNDRLLTLMTKYYKLAHPETTKVAVPISASSEIDLLANELGLTVVRTKDSHLALMEAASDKETRFVGGTKGGFIFNEFMFASDGMYSVVKLLECLAITKKSLGDLDSETPRLHSVKKNLPCAWHLKGRVLRKLMEATESMHRVLIEGIKVFPNGGREYTTVMLNPDRTRALFHINAESPDLALAQRLSNEYESKIKRWLTAEE
jgi:mannose-1-phosphate guanylyltransferase/phosphomannomutase